MSFEITVPRLGWSMEEGTFVRWLKQEGDYVKAGEAVFELEGEKAAQDIEAVDEGFLRIPASAPKPGSIVPVGAVLGYLVAEGEAIPDAVASAPSAPRPSAPQQSAPPATEASVPRPIAVAATAQSVTVPATGHDFPAAPPSVRRLAREKGIKLASLDGTGPAGRITADDVHHTIPSPAPVANAVVSQFSSPRARRTATELGIDWRCVRGTGRDGRVREADVRLSASQQSPAAAAGSVSTFPTSRRRTIASRMMASQQQTAAVTLTSRIDATNLVGLRKQFKQAATDGLVPSFNDIIIKLVALVLKQHLALATRAEGDQWIVPSPQSDLQIGLAVDTDDGLVVPVVRNVSSSSLFQLAKQSAALIEKSRAGTLTVSEMQGGVFTISNLGSFGIDSFTPIINLPETAVLGLGRIRREAVVVDDQIVARDQLTLSLTFDHRVVDGAPAARFLQTVCSAIENPSAWLLRGDV
ncbi:dihydrolipoamide acetyltransferase family protein [Schlesneria sp.]|uniref:dihydrolipoamide acetyltransferase family protein n=1 Tax=Schlesneria sp. TaxID=2762018 RepID=UPI002F025609